MIFVLAVVMFRAVRGQHGEEQHEYSQITIIAEEIMDNPNTSPPSYRDEKVPIVDETVRGPKSSHPSYVNKNYPIAVETVKASNTSKESKARTRFLSF